MASDDGPKRLVESPEALMQSMEEVLSRMTIRISSSGAEPIQPRANAPRFISIWVRAMTSISPIPAHSRWVFLLVLGALVTAITGCSGNKSENNVAPEPEPASAETVDRPMDRKQLLTEAIRALQSGETEKAETLVAKQLIAQPRDSEALILAGHIAIQNGDSGSAIDLYMNAIEYTSASKLEALDHLTTACIRAGRAFDAIGLLHRFIERYPDFAEPRFDLAGLTMMVGIPEFSLAVLPWLFQHKSGDNETLLLMANPTRIKPDIDACDKMLGQAESDIRLRYASARLDSMELNWGGVAERLEPVLERHDQFVPAYALYGRALVELNRLSEIPEWNSLAPKTAKQSPQYWMAVGRYAESVGEPGLAAEAFLNVQRINPTAFPESLGGLYRACRSLGLDEQAERVAQQIEAYIRLRDAFRVYLDRKSQSQSAAIAVAEVMAELGRMWEAEAWARHATTLQIAPAGKIKERYLAIRSRLKVTTPWILPEMDLGSSISIPDGMIPQGDAFALDANRSFNSTVGFRESSVPYFENQASELGLKHTCEVARTTNREGHWLHQSSGGGIGVIDFDLDSRPDVIGTMLDGQPLQNDSSPNRLFRNLDSGFLEVGSNAKYVDRGFSLGITIGDINSDGFPDVLDTNIGQNRLFINNGDGTFRETSLESGLKDSTWSMSGAIADFDSDGIADVFVANYCAGTEPFVQGCRSEGRFSACAPTLFNAQSDRVWRGSGDGTFQDVTDKWMDQVSIGRGLGVVVGELDENPGLDIYVANDMTANHLWAGRAEDTGFHLVNIASISGVGVNGKSQSQASMGIAAADADNDGDLDLLLTHFAKEHNTFYEQLSPGRWDDRSFQSGLAAPSMKLLGFGTEWCDFDQDGWKELIVTNGHVDNYHLKDIGYAMPGQVFRQTAPGRWETCDREGLGDYFVSDHVGRALASVDIDRDGRTDVLVTHLYEPVALLMNRTEAIGNSVDLMLTATLSHRDAIGAKVSGTIGNRKSTAFLTAGDGYLCSNERKLSFGLGDANAMTDVTITWPSGAVESFDTLQAGYTYLIVEGQEPFQWMAFDR